MKITVTTRDTAGGDFITKELKSIASVSSKDIKRIANRCETVLRHMIDIKTEGGTGALSQSMAWTPEKITNGWGVGDIDKLDITVPYWNHQDKGSEGINANWEHFLPKGLWVNGRWVVSGRGFSGIKPSTPIPAKHYIASTLAQMEIEIPKLLKG